MPAGDIYAEVIELMQAHGATLVRTKKHHVYEFPDGRHFTIAASPSDRRHAGMNAMRDLRRFLGQVPEHKAGERREKKRKTVRRKLWVATAPPKLEIRERFSIQLLSKLRPSLVAPKLECSPVRIERHQVTPMAIALGRLFR